MREINKITEPVEAWVLGIFLGVMLGIPAFIWVIAITLEHRDLIDSSVTRWVSYAVINHPRIFLVTVLSAIVGLIIVVIRGVFFRKIFN